MPPARADGFVDAPRLMRAVAPEAAGRAVRLSFAHYNTIEEVDRCFDVIDAALDRSTVESNSDDETESGAEAISR